MDGEQFNPLRLFGYDKWDSNPTSAWPEQHDDQHGLWRRWQPLDSKYVWTPCEYISAYARGKSYDIRGARSRICYCHRCWQRRSALVCFLELELELRDRAHDDRRCGY